MCHVEMPLASIQPSRFCSRSSMSMTRNMFAATLFLFSWLLLLFGIAVVPCRTPHMPVVDLVAGVYSSASVSYALTKSTSGIRLTWSSSPQVCLQSNELGSYFLSALGNSKCVNDMLVAHCCVTDRPMSPCFVATSCSYCIFNHNRLDQCHINNLNESGIKFCDSSSIECFCCNAFHPKKTTTPNLMAGGLWFEYLAVIWLRSSPVCQLVVSAAWLLLEQSVLSACSVSFRLSFWQVEFCSHLFQVTI